MQFVQGPRLPDRRADPRPRRHHRRATAPAAARSGCAPVAEIEEDRKGGQRIVVTEVPYQTSVEVIGAKIAELVERPRASRASATSATSRPGDTTRLVIELKRDANAQVVLNQLYKHTPMQTNFAREHGRARRRRAAHAQPRAGARRSTSTTRSRSSPGAREYRLRKAQDRAHIVEGLLKALDVIDAIIALIRGSRDRRRGRARR